ncbi:MAG TPA: hypothetical protein VLC91_04075 [Spongiibacteraceae bacterium]|nr:hypothetical protein [Spongiibacteraceae bacterium]
MPGIVAILFMLTVSLALNAQEYAPLKGEYYFAGKTLIDPPDDEAHDTHMRIALTGNAARDLYSAMKVPAKADRCEPDKLVKIIGGMQCTSAAHDRTFECNFSIDIANQRIAGATAC